MNIRLEKHLGYMWSRGSQGGVCDHPNPQQESPDEAQHAHPPAPGVERQGFAAEEQVLCLVQLYACLGSAPLLLGCGFVLAVSPLGLAQCLQQRRSSEKSLTHSAFIYWMMTPCQRPVYMVGICSEPNKVLPGPYILVEETRKKKDNI